MPKRQKFQSYPVASENDEVARIEDRGVLCPTKFLWIVDWPKKRLFILENRGLKGLKG